ncbi:MULTISPECIES: YceI family protein [Mycobacterium]|nr:MULTISPECIES: YceI family protein [Mycobacterium]MCA2356960.1 YceI family protein [Mycobacterium intracellulare]MCA2365379.1 YceI family protein [Mycobacterium intracellulare]UQB93866.1 YceI family protein [Mycobacterium intracellulare]WSE45415.1 YceI family protein [Mycobacterium sp. 3-98]
MFEARWMFGICTATGVFERCDGWALLPGNGSLVGELSIDSSSVNTGNRLRDHDLQKKLFLDSRNYPVITLTSGDVTIAGRSIAGAGHLTVRDRSVEVPVCGTACVDADRLILKGSATLDVRRFGWPTAFGYIRRSLIVNAAVSLVRHG